MGESFRIVQDAHHPEVIERSFRRGGIPILVPDRQQSTGSV